MLHGRVNSAIRLLGSTNSGGVLPLDADTIKKLKKKHPRAAPAYTGSLLNRPIDQIPVTYYDSIDEFIIERAIKSTKGAAGPSNMTGDFIQQLCNKKFASEGHNFNAAMARLARKLATEHIDPLFLESFLVCKLIPSNKCPGIRPIGVGEVIRRVIGKVISWTVKKEAMEAAGPLQVAAGLKSGSEAVIHAMRGLYSDPDTEGIILIDATNAFNQMNRTTALHNIQIICPEVATYLINTYRAPARLIIKGENNTGLVIFSYEGTTQGDNLGMIFYSLATILIVRNLSNIILKFLLAVKQAWLADDASAVGKLKDLKV